MSNAAKKIQDDLNDDLNSDDLNNEPLSSESSLTDFHFHMGDLVQHELYGYRGVIVNQDSHFKGSEDQLKRLNLTSAQTSGPWYQVLIDGTDNIAYIEERNLKEDLNTEPIEHPMIFEFFDRFENGRYLRVLH